MVTKYEYFAKYYQILKENPQMKCEEAYKRTEQWQIEKSGKNRYISYASFRVMKTEFDAIEKLTK